MHNESNDQLQSTFLGQRIAIRGKLEGVSRRELHKAIRAQGGELVPFGTPADFVVIDTDDAVAHELRTGIAPPCQILTERELWQRLGMLDDAPGVERGFTVGMIARIVDVPTSTVRRWVRKRLLIPDHEVFKVGYFSFREVTIAKRLKSLLESGVTLSSLERTNAELLRLVPGSERPITEMSYVVEGKQLLFRAHGALVDSIGQLRFDFESLEQELDEELNGSSGSETAEGEEAQSPERLERRAHWLEDHDQLLEAVHAYRAALAAKGADAELNFQLADLLYRLGDVSAARERYYVAIEIDENLVEARKNLGCVLLETGEKELAIAAFQGALAIYPEYADVHFHLAQVLDEVGRSAEADPHWRRFTDLAPDSPWAEEIAGRH